MTITCDTSLEEILDYNTVTSIVSEDFKAIRDVTLPRRTTINREIETDAIKNGKIAGETLMYTKGKEVYELYGIFHTSLAELETRIKTKTREKEIEELTELVKAINEKIDDLNGEKNSIANKIKQTPEGDEKNALINQSRNISLTIKGYAYKKQQASARIKNRGGATETAEPSEEAEPGPSSGGLTLAERTEYTIKTGDMVKMDDGNEYEFLMAGRDEHGKTYTFYIGQEDHCIYAVDSEGNRTKTEFNESDPYGIRIQEKYEGMVLYDQITTSNTEAAKMRLPAQKNITAAKLDAEQSYDISDIYVQYGELSSTEVTHVTSSKDLHQAAMEQQPVITIDATKLEDNQNFFQNLTGPSNDITVNSGSNQITLIYDANTGMYYNMDQNGGYEINSYNGITPQELQKFTIEN